MAQGSVDSAQQKDRAERRASIGGVQEIIIADLEVESAGGTPPAAAEQRPENQDGKLNGPAEPGFRKAMSDSEIKDAVEAFPMDNPVPKRQLYR